MRLLGRRELTVEAAIKRLVVATGVLFVVICLAILGGVAYVVHQRDADRAAARAEIARERAVATARRKADAAQAKKNRYTVCTEIENLKQLERRRLSEQIGSQETFLKARPDVLRRLGLSRKDVEVGLNSARAARARLAPRDCAVFAGLVRRPPEPK